MIQIDKLGLQIPEPCGADLDNMSGDERRRFCDLCERHVTNISQMTEREARGFLERTDYRECVSFEVIEGRILFVPEPERRFQRQRAGLKRLIAAAALAAPLGLVACSPAPLEPGEDEQVAPLVIDYVGVKLGIEPVEEEDEVITCVEPVAQPEPVLEPEPVVAPEPVVERATSSEPRPIPRARPTEPKEGVEEVVPPRPPRELRHPVRENKPSLLEVIGVVPRPDRHVYAGGPSRIDEPLDLAHHEGKAKVIE